MTDDTIGVDISKAHLDAFRLEDGAAHRFENSAAGFRALRKWLGKAPVARIVFEPTGPYHKAFEAALGETFPLVKVNPFQARRFAEAHGVTARNRDILCSMPGISAVTAAAMLTLLPNIGTLQRKQVASLTGLAPIMRQSGQWQGKSFIGGGRKALADRYVTLVIATPLKDLCRDLVALMIAAVRNGPDASASQHFMTPQLYVPESF